MGGCVVLLRGTGGEVEVLAKRIGGQSRRDVSRGSTDSRWEAFTGKTRTNPVLPLWPERQWGGVR